MIDVDSCEVNPDDYELVNIKAIEDEVRALYFKQEDGGGFNTTRDNDRMEVERWYALIRKHTAYRNPK